MGSDPIKKLFLCWLFLCTVTVHAQTGPEYAWNVYGKILYITADVDAYCFEVFVDLTSLMKDQGFILQQMLKSETEEEDPWDVQRFYTAAEYRSKDGVVAGVIQNDTTRDVVLGEDSRSWTAEFRTAAQNIRFRVTRSDPEKNDLQIFPENRMENVLPERINREELVLFLYGMETMQVDPARDPFEALGLIPKRKWTDETGVMYSVYSFSEPDLENGYLVSDEAKNAGMEQTTILEKLGDAYAGNPSLCRMSPRMAEAYAEKILSETTPPAEQDTRVLDKTGSGNFTCLLADVGGDGQPFLILIPPKTERNSGDKKAETCPVKTILLYQCQDGNVTEVLFDMDRGDYFLEKEPDKEILLSEPPYLIVQYRGTLKEDPAKEVLQENYYQASGGELRLSHTALVILDPSSGKEQDYFDGKPVSSLESAGLAYGEKTSLPEGRDAEEFARILTEYGIQDK